MTKEDIAAYLTAAAWADGPISETESRLVENLLYGLGHERDEAHDRLRLWQYKAPAAPDLASLRDREQAIALLRALLVLSYSDGHFGIEELPYLSKILDKFKVSTEELVQLRLQGRYYLDPEAAALEIPEEYVVGGDWDQVAEAARQERTLMRAEAERRIREELSSATMATLLLILYRGRSYDLKDAEAEFEKRRGDLIERHGARHDEALLQAQIGLLTLAKWDRLYAERCAACGLEAPGLKGSLCPRCKEDYQ